MPLNPMEYGGHRDEEHQAETPTEHHRAVNFVNAAKEGNLDRAQVDDFVFGPEQAPRVGLERWERFQNEIKAEKLDDYNIRIFAQDLETLRREAKVELGNATNEYHMETQDLDQTAAYINRAIDGTITKHILEKSEHYPVLGLVHQEPEIQETWLKSVEMTIDNMEETHQWQYLNGVMRLLTHQAEKVNAQGTQPQGVAQAIPQEGTSS